ncbi:hypothetical protein O9G_002956 [Rozella allomycis CSF55]|uniref:Uncharacterized protein n=1 Tax=Rozella allomycis (strain CSF55) TaxID=988480 RepID=A0A075ANM8_ROZAC|nr:hypothetical protein O9G_002956 [Rozella allomycis CSF55]|eukprot:EPZ31487.1 hypothetical protein O9G_002956 [Rozella allomycis CSF55]
MKRDRSELASANKTSDLTVEGISYPGFSDISPPLPQNQDCQQQLNKVIVENLHAIDKTDFEKHQGDLYDRLAEYFVKTNFCEGNLKYSGENDLYLGLSDIFAQTLFIILCEGFPLSAHVFTLSMQQKVYEDVCNLIIERQGYQPAFLAWECWPLDNLLPAIIKANRQQQKDSIENSSLYSRSMKYGRRSGGKTSSGRPKSSKNIGESIFDMDDKVTKSLNTLNTSNLESSFLEKTCITKKIPFHSAQKSPLVLHYLNKRKADIENVRTHITKVSYVPTEELRKRDTIAKTVNDSRNRNKQTLLNLKKKEMKKIDNECQKILSKAAETKSMSDKIVETWIGKVNKPISKTKDGK